MSKQEYREPILGMGTWQHRIRTRTDTMHGGERHGECDTRLGY